MANDDCPARRAAPNTNWAFCPSKAPAYLYIVLFGLTLIAHIAQAIVYRKGYSWVIAMGAAWETGNYIFRILSIDQPSNVGFYSAWFILILLAPLWINAYVYMVLGRMVYNFTSSAKILHVKAWRFGLIFVLLDILAFLAQAAGASMATGSNITPAAIERGLHIYMGGVGLQQIFILIFLYLTYRFQKEMQRDLPVIEQPRVLHLLYAIYAALTLISIRIIFRLAEYSQGYTSGPSLHEAYQYVFDSTMMLFALVAFNIVHPGRIMPGKESNFPSRKERKIIGKRNVRGRAEAGCSLSLDETSREESLYKQSSNPNHSRIDASTVNNGYVAESDTDARYNSEWRSRSEGRYASDQRGFSMGKRHEPTRAYEVI